MYSKKYYRYLCRYFSHRISLTDLRKRRTRGTISSRTRRNSSKKYPVWKRISRILNWTCKNPSKTRRQRTIKSETLMMRLPIRTSSSISSIKRRKTRAKSIRRPPRSFRPLRTKSITSTKSSSSSSRPSTSLKILSSVRRSHGKQIQLPVII